ncbi:MAG: ribose 5-phosphate isomerase B [Elusimicrobia bacterium]|nr:ribose 5-phosphate isomerase B [Elusimicrobiota bacterium]
MNVAIACDHAGFILKETVIKQIKENGHTPVDLGANSTTAVDYPDFAKALAQCVLSGKAQRGIMVCGSGVGACMTANKFKGIRAGLCHDTYSAAQAVEHDDMNVLCLGARVIGASVAISVANAFLKAKFTSEERHLRRLGKINQIEAENFRANSK